MKRSMFVFIGVCTVAARCGAADPPPKVAAPPAPRFPQIEIEAKFFTISATAAERVGVTCGPGDWEPKWPGVLSAPACEKLLRTLGKEKSMKLLSSPRVTTKPGQHAVVEVIREFRYPTAFVESGEPADHLSPAKFETVETGVTLDVETKLGAGDFIELAMMAKLMEFNRFVSYEGGRTQKSEPIPKGGFSQPVFDTAWNSASVTLRPGETVLLDGSEWAGASGLTFERVVNPKVLKSEGDARAEPELLFVAVTARIIRSEPPHGGIYGELKAGGDMELQAELVNISRDRLPAGILKEGVELPEAGAMALSGVLDPREAGQLRKALEKASMAQVSSPSPKVMASDGRYLVEASGSLRYPGEVGKIGAGGGRQADEMERMDLRLEMKPQAIVDDGIDLDIVSALSTSAPPFPPGGGAPIEWKFRKEDSPGTARGGSRPGTTSVAMWNAQMLVFVRASVGRPDQLQVLLITLRAPGRK